MLQRCVVGDQLLDLVLGEIPDPQLAARRHVPCHRAQLPGHEPRQGRLTVAVSTQKRDPVIGIDPEIQLREHGRVGHIADSCIIGHDQWRAQFVRVGEIKPQGRIFHGGGNRFHPCQSFHAALGLFGRVGLIAPAIHIGLQLGALVFLAPPHGLDLAQTLGTLPFEGVVPARVQRRLAALHMQNVIGDIVQQISLMTDDDHGGGIGPQE